MILIRGLASISCFLSFLLLFSNNSKNEYTGIAFSSHEEVIDLRTGIDFTPGTTIKFDKNLSLSFDISFRRNQRVFGYIFRIVSDQGLNVDLVSRRNGIVLIVGDSTTNLTFPFGLLEPGKNKWKKLVITLNKVENSITLSLDGQSKSEVIDFDIDQFSLLFGKNNSGEFSTTDVPPINLRNVIIESDAKIVRNWPFLKHGNDYVLDEVNHHLAKIINPNWVSDLHINWSHLRSIATPTRPQLVFDGENTIFLINEAVLTVIDIPTNSQSRVELQNSAKLPMAQQSLYLPDKGQVWTYDFYREVINVLDVNSYEWTEVGSDFSRQPDRWHVNKITTKQQSLFFGGYGHHTYKNEILVHSDGGWDSWQPLNMEPRYLSAMGVNDSEDIYLFGGYGSKSGRQEQNPKPFYQLFRINTSLGTSEKLWEQNDIAGDYVFSNSMIIENDSSFYVLKYPRDKYSSYINLEKYALYTGEKVTFSDTLDFKFHDVTSYADLFYNATNNLLVAALLNESNSGGYETHLHTIKLPALLPADVLQAGKIASEPDYQWWAIIIASVMFLSIGIWLRKRTLKPASTSELQAVVPENLPNESTLNEVTKSSAINLMGGFQVLDKEGKDISERFTATLKTLLALLLLHSIRNNKGVTSTIIWETIWSDKPENKARNNRNVNIKKLRELLKEVGDINILNNGEYWFIELSEDVFFDYLHVKNLLSGGSFSKDIVMLAKKGNIFPAIETDWIDGFKSEFSNQLVDHLLKMRHHYDHDDHMLVEIADAIFKHDIINQDALVMKCKSLNKTGKFALAKGCYDAFAHEYKQMYDEDFHMQFENIIH